MSAKANLKKASSVILILLMVIGTFSFLAVQPVAAQTVNGYVPITLTNSQATATNATFPCMITINSSAYSAYIWANWSNVVFTTGPADTGTSLYAWVEANATNTNTSTVVWVTLVSAITAGSNQTIYMNFMSANEMTGTTGYTGENPLLSSSYGALDNGALVFSYYTNFSGASLPSGWVVASAGGSYTVNNGVLINDVSGWETLLYNVSFNPQTTSLEMYGYLNNPVYANNAMFGCFNDTSTGYPQYLLISYNSLYYIDNYNGSLATTSTTALSVTTNKTLTIWTNTTGTFATVNYASLTYLATDFTAGTTKYAGIGVISNMVGYMQYARERATPPSNTMPTATFGTMETPPAYCSSISANSSINGSATVVSSYWQSSVGLSGYIVQTNNTGTQINQTWASFSATPGWANYTFTLNSTAGDTVAVTVYANDTGGNWQTATLSILLTGIGSYTINVFANATTATGYAFVYVPQSYISLANTGIFYNGTQLASWYNATSAQPYEQIFSSASERLVYPALNGTDQMWVVSSGTGESLIFSEYNITTLQCMGSFTSTMSHGEWFTPTIYGSDVIAEGCDSTASHGVIQIINSSFQQLSNFTSDANITYIITAIPDPMQSKILFGVDNNNSTFGILSIDESQLTNSSAYTFIPIAANTFDTAMESQIAVFNNTVYVLCSTTPSDGTAVSRLYSSTDLVTWNLVWAYQCPFTGSDYFGHIASTSNYLLCGIYSNATTGTATQRIYYLNSTSSSWYSYNTGFTGHAGGEQHLDVNAYNSTVGIVENNERGGTSVIHTVYTFNVQTGTLTLLTALGDYGFDDRYVVVDAQGNLYIPDNCLVLGSSSATYIINAPFTPAYDQVWFAMPSMAANQSIVVTLSTNASVTSNWNQTSVFSGSDNFYSYLIPAASGTGTTIYSLSVPPFNITSLSPLYGGTWNAATEVLTFIDSASVNITNTGGFYYPAGVSGALQTPAVISFTNGVLNISTPSAANTTMVITYLWSTAISNLTVIPSGGTIYNVTYNGGQLTINASGNVNVTFPNGYPGSNFTVTVNGSVWSQFTYNATAGTINITGLNSNYISQIVIAFNNYLTVTASSNGSLNVTSGWYPIGALPILATPNSGYDFQYIQFNGANSSSNPYTATMDANYSVTAFFTVSGGGSGGGGGGGGSINTTKPSNGTTNQGLGSNNSTSSNSSSSSNSGGNGGGGNPISNAYNSLPTAKKAAVVVISTFSIIFVAILLFIIGSRALQKGSKHAHRNSRSHKGNGGRKR